MANKKAIRNWVTTLEGKLSTAVPLPPWEGKFAKQMERGHISYI